MSKDPRLLALLENGTVLEFIADEGVVCPSCNQDFLFCLANEPPNCSVLALAPEQLISGGHARVIESENLTEADRFIKNFATRESSKHIAAEEPRLLIRQDNGRLLEFILDDGVVCPSCNQDFLRCLAAGALGLPESANCATFDLTPEQLVAHGYARIVAPEDVTEKDRLVMDFPKWVDQFKQNLLKAARRTPNSEK